MASDRPLIVHAPSSVKVIQSPWRHTPGKCSKYASRYRAPVGSPQNPTGIDGIGAVRTSSPVVPGGTGCPSASNASTAHPSSAQEISPARTGTSGEVPTKAVHTSVPPLIELTGTPTVSCTQRNPAAGSGAPVDPTHRSARGGGSIPALRQAIRNGAEVPRTVVPVSAASCQSVPRSGWPGSPSNRTIVEPARSPDTR